MTDKTKQKKNNIKSYFIKVEDQMELLLSGNKE